MNLFVLSQCPRAAARLLAQVHRFKMLVETTQILHTALGRLGLAEEGDYKTTHAAHPCVDWVCAAYAHFEWALLHGLELLALYDEWLEENRKPPRVHACESPLHSVVARLAAVHAALPDALSAEAFLHGHPRRALLAPKVRTVDAPLGCRFGVLAADGGGESLLEAYRSMYVAKGTTMFLEWSGGFPAELCAARSALCAKGAALLTEKPAKRKPPHAPHGSLPVTKRGRVS